MRPPQKTRVAFSLLALIAAMLVVTILLPSAFDNNAEQSVKPLVSAVRGLGGEEICNGGNAAGITDVDGGGTWYSAYYRVPYSRSMKTDLTAAAKKAGFNLVDTENKVYRLRAGSDPVAEASQMLMAIHANMSLRVTISRGDPIEADCAAYKLGNSDVALQSNEKQTIIEIAVVDLST